MSTHSCVLAPHLKAELAAVADGKYGRMFDGLPCYEADEGALLALGRAHAVIDSLLEPDTAGPSTDNPGIPAGFPITCNLLPAGCCSVNCWSVSCRFISILTTSRTTPYPSVGRLMSIVLGKGTPANSVQLE